MSVTSIARRDAARFLDALRAAEAASAQVLEAWISVCTFEGLRGGLRAIAEREGRARRAHRGAPARAGRALHGRPPGADPRRRARALRLRLGHRRGEARALPGALPDDAAATRPFSAMIESLPDDTAPASCSTWSADGEIATLRLARAYHEGLVARMGER
jgi:hypothetical protein